MGGRGVGDKEGRWEVRGWEIGGWEIGRGGGR